LNQFITPIRGGKPPLDKGQKADIKQKAPVEMGLSICKSIIESHNGRIRVTAGAPRRSIFQFELPTSGATN
jgi:K+-sensing histidine kinase KdpD